MPLDDPPTSTTPPVVRLCAATVDELADRCPVPEYDRDALRPSIVHLGVGGFHRAHLATYVDDLCRAGSTDWGIVGAGLLPADRAMADALEPQDELYVLVSRGADDTEARVIGSIVDYVLAVDDLDALLDLIAAPTTQIVSMTITEGGYPVDDVTGRYVPERNAPGSAFAVLADGLERRRQRTGRPLTVLSCDNIMENGHVARVAALGAAAEISDELCRWIEAEVSFPNSMVDRITPATTDDDVAWVERHLGIADRWPVVAEPFRQWVVEDRFAGDRLPLEDLDVIVTDDIEPYELTKLRLLNAGHSCLAYLASLDGFVTVDAAMADPQLGRFVHDLLHTEAKPTLPPAAGIDLDDYIASLIERFSNPAIGDQIARLCLDGTAKFPKFLIPTIRTQLATTQRVTLAATALAGWCEYLRTGDAATLAKDPQLDTAVEHARRSLDDPAAFLAFEDVFGDVGRHPVFADAFSRALSMLRDRGVQSTVSAALEESEPHDERHPIAGHH